MRTTLCLLLIPGTFCLSAWAGDSGDDALAQEAQTLVQQFAGQLKPQLQAALQEGGPALAIEVCAAEAPRIADALSAGSGWQVKRVSLKSRNASRAIPDPWERAVLEQFDARQAAGESVMSLSYSETVGQHFRHMQAQVADPVCLTCHGQSLSAPAREALQQYYPDDLATGYTTGQVRGAFSLSKPIRR